MCHVFVPSWIPVPQIRNKVSLWVQYHKQAGGERKRSQQVTASSLPFVLSVFWHVYISAFLKRAALLRLTWWARCEHYEIHSNFLHRSAVLSRFVHCAALPLWYKLWTDSHFSSWPSSDLAEQILLFKYTPLPCSLLKGVHKDKFFLGGGGYRYHSIHC